MKEKALTDSELLVLGLVAEMPRHGYELEQTLIGRGMREWTQIGFSSIYFVLGQLEKKGLVVAGKQASAKAKKSFSITEAGRRALVRETLAAFATIRSSFSPLLMGLLHWPVLSRDEALGALQKRGELIQQELARLESIQFDQQPLPDHVDALFDYSLHQLRAESEWIARTLAYMQTKPQTS
jgi:DNA-binding PadR family transcriptional regulator